MAQLQERLQGALGERYTIERELGRGGWSVVFLAWDKKNERRVALKVLRPELVATVGRRRFLDEIRFITQFNHPFILVLHEWEPVDEDLLYYVMPFEAESLRDRLDREARLPVTDAVRIAREAAEALEYAHHRRVVHRDIKPENILLKAGHAVVSDFGIALAVSVAQEHRVSGTDVVLGTPEYMSPEQARRAPLDGRTDIYSLGVTLYEMLVGDLPRLDLQDSMKALERVRPDVSPALARAVRRALASEPADRFASAKEFADQLSGLGKRGVHERPLVRAAAAVAITLAAFGAWRVAVANGDALDPNKVVVFPLVDRSGEQGQGEDVASLIGSALEHTEPLRWIDGWTRLDASQRADLTLLTAAAARAIARSRGARYYIDGSIVTRVASTTVILRLHDVDGDSLLAQESASGEVRGPSATQLGFQAVNRVLPRLLEPGRRVDLAVLTERKPASVASWLQGEREYRRSNFEASLVYLRRAVSGDSALAVAALRGAQAASWTGRLDEASAFARVALADIRRLPARQVQFARGLVAYIGGRPDSAVHWLRSALAAAPDWSEAHMALGEVYHHLLPATTAPLDSLAEAEFRAAAADTGFAPVRFHLAEIAIRSGDVDRAEQAVQQFERFRTGPSEERRELELMLACARRGSDGVDWRTIARDSSYLVLSTAKMLAVAGAFPECAEDAFRAVLATPSAGDLHWGGFLALQHVLAAQERRSAIETLVDSLNAAGMRRVTNAYLVDALAAVPGFDVKVDETIGSLQRAYGSMYEDSLRSTMLLLLGAWYARSFRVSDAVRLQDRLTRQAARSNDPEARLYADALAAHLALARGDSAAALAAFEKLVPVARRDFLVWGNAESLPFERLTRAKLLLSHGRYEDAIDVASAFDHPTPIVYLAFLPASLALRYQAAEALSRSREAATFRERLLALTGSDRLLRDTHPLF